VTIDLQRHVTRRQFTDQLHTVFSLRAGEVVLDAELVDVTARDDLPGAGQYSLVFRVAADTPAAQALWGVEHPELGVQPMLLVPVRRDADGLYLEAAFNQLIPAGEEV